MKKRSFLVLGMAALLLAAWLLRDDGRSPQEAATPSATPSGSAQETPRARPRRSRELTPNDRFAAILNAPSEAPELLELFDGYPICEIPGVQAQTKGLVRSDGLELPFFIVAHGKGALMDTGSGSGTLLLQGYEATPISWIREEEQLWCSEVNLVPTGGPWAVTARVVDASGSPIIDGEVYGCGRHGDIVNGELYMTLLSDVRCKLDVRGPNSARVVFVDPIEADIDLGTIALPEEIGTLGLDLSHAQFQWEPGLQPQAFYIPEPPRGTPAQLAGLKEGDFIVAVDGLPVAGRHPAELLIVNVGETRTLELSGGRHLTLTAVPLREMLELAGFSKEEVAERLPGRSGGYY